jgi:GTP-binding protein Era
LKSGFVGLIGCPNVGKSTLLNGLIGEKISIVSDKPQTTRHRLQGILTRPEGQVIFVDTPGVHKPKHRLGEYMIDVSFRSLMEADVVFYMTDVEKGYGAREHFIITRLKTVHVPIFLLINKVDLAPAEKVNELAEAFTSQMHFAEVLFISAMQQINTDRLLEKVWEYLPEGPMYYPEDDLTDQPMSFIAAELIREKSLQLTRDEVPHAIAVEVEEFKLQTAKTWYIRAAIYAERDSQKGIIIGKQGKMLKQIGELARSELEAMLNRKVYLDLWVKVKKNWRDNEANLNQLGFKPHS